MFICGEGHIFEEPVMLLEHYYDIGEELYGCPMCGDGFSEYEEDEYIDENYDE